MTIEEIYKIYLTHPMVITDSRKIELGCLFFALKGEKFNGNKFAANAIQKGAAFAVIDEEEYEIPGKTVLVKNVLTALQDLAHYHREQLGIPIIGITGSNGKTTTKELIAAVLEKKYNIVFTQGNFNNHIGVPLTLLQMNSDTEIGVVEMGANHPYEIGELCSIADPDYGIITNIGRAHLEGFGSFETIKETKAELYKHVCGKKGVVFYNRDNSVLEELINGYSNKISYGETNADFVGEPVFSPPYIHAKVNFPKGVLYLNTRLTGRYNFENILAAACIGNYFKVDPLEIQEAVGNYRPQNNRSQLVEKNGLKIIMDAYNANPTSMQASIDSFVSMFAPPRVLILGDMLELGEKSPEEHLQILEQTKKHPFEAVFLVGPLFNKAAQNYSYLTFPDSGELCRYLIQNPIKAGAVLVKGSRGIQLEKVLEAV
ncbi:UDP-N-acetylmuramoyl-tripeptide--D-alanyl-D-alanine ligase [Mariniphaga anaerophila]|uniref:UDP-N-acetylmuramoyl-tripeptide--D-alanyl-D-alanine ligase n=1 Tax=Mariniphaga anaerophila TaxID=1484053 RepID=A0A1M4Y1L5_9BACT|nr:UDP-N-acetylmuramoyl-tripeptide--D-alanyl-D-alanine ligase [Mariniphaga anaerophila]SHE99486.1 UDP-N-acetylmuramoyl-tripeptide--D-alanyl-D-alanine ligase [Mariniphaga anaerophila]